MISFVPYEDNGGNVASIAGDNFVVVGSDTRLCFEHTIYTRRQSKFFPLTKTAILGCVGCWCDVITFTNMIEARMQMYGIDNNKVISMEAIAQMMAILLYRKRFFPYYVVSLLAGMDSNGKGTIFSYDPIGHYERSQMKAVGSAASFIQPFLDNQIGQTNMSNANMEPITVPRALEVLKDAFTSAAERNIQTGDTLDIRIITGDGIVVDTFNLRKD